MSLKDLEMSLKHKGPAEEIKKLRDVRTSWLGCTSCTRMSLTRALELAHRADLDLGILGFGLPPRI